MQPFQRGRPLPGPVHLLAPFQGVRAQQVVEGVPVRRVLLQEVGTGQPGQELRGDRKRYTGERCRRRQGDVRARDETEQPEQPGGGLLECDVGHVQDRSDGTLLVPGYLQRGQRVAGQPGHLVRDGAVRVDREIGRRDPDREGQVGAGGRELGDRLPFRAAARFSDHVEEELFRLGGLQDAQRHRDGGVPGHEPGQGVPAGDQDQALGVAGKQGADVLGGACVVQDDEDPLARAERAVEGGRPGLLGGDVLRGHTERLEESAERVEGPQRPAGGVAAEVHVQLSVREPVTSAVAPVNGQGGLPRPGLPGDQTDPHRARRLVPTDRQQHVEAPERIGPAGEHRGGSGQLGGEGMLARGDRRPVGRPCRRRPAGAGVEERGVVGQHPAVERVQLRARLQAEFTDQFRPRTLVRDECLAPPSAAVQSEHQLAVQPLAQRVAGDGGLDVHEDGRMPAEAELRLDPLLEGGHAGVVEPWRLDLGQLLRTAARQSVSPPQGQRGAQPGGGRGVVPPLRRLGRGGGQPVELAQVQHGVFQQQDVAPGPGRQYVPVTARAAQDVPEPLDVVLQGGAGRGRRRVSPEAVDQILGRNDLVRPQQQEHEQIPLLGSGHRNGLAPAHDLQRPQNPVVEQPAPFTLHGPGAYGSPRGNRSLVCR